MMNKKLLSTATGIFLTMSACTSTSGSEKPQPVSEVEAIIQSELDRIDSYWSSQPLGNTAVQLVFLEGNDNYFCPSIDQSEAIEIRADERDKTGMCLTTGDLVFPEAALPVFVDIAKESGSPLLDPIRIVLAHEYGHAQQGFRNSLKINNSQYERQADCLAGQAIRNVMPSVISNSIEFYQELGKISDESHGEPLQRAQAFVYGATNETCK
jgi:hypothetical protein